MFYIVNNKIENLYFYLLLIILKIFDYNDILYKLICKNVLK